MCYLNPGNSPSRRLPHSFNGWKKKICLVYSKCGYSLRNEFCFITVYTFVREFLHKLHNNLTANTMTNKCDLAIFHQRFIDECKFMANLSIQSVKRFIPYNQTGQILISCHITPIGLLGEPFKSIEITFEWLNSWNIIMTSVAYTPNWYFDF